MRFAVLGAGGIGGLIGAHLARAGEQVLLVARGAHLAAMRERGLRVIGDGEDFVVKPECTDDLASIGSADAVFLTLKAHSLPAIAAELGRHLGRSATLVTAQNGLPWWYFQNLHGPLSGLRLETVDPGGVLTANIPPERLVGCVVYPATRIVEPGVIEHVEGNRLSLGELNGDRSERCEQISAALTMAGFKAPVQSDLRTEIWVKLLGNAVFNPVSALTRATLAQIVGNGTTRDVAKAAMEEVAAVAAAAGVRLPISVERRLRGAERVGEHRTSMLQDLENGRPLELEAVLGSVVELARHLSVDVPRLEVLYALTGLLRETAS